jgi:hypothetical protein
VYMAMAFSGLDSMKTSRSFVMRAGRGQSLHLQPLPLLLPVLAVILSEAKGPDGLRQTKAARPFLTQNSSRVPHPSRFCDGWEEQSPRLQLQPGAPFIASLSPAMSGPTASFFPQNPSKSACQAPASPEIARTIASSTTSNKKIVGIVVSPNPVN